MARMRAAKPAALEARPAAVGKLFELTMRRGWAESGGREGSAFSSWERRARREARQAVERGVERDWGTPLRRRVSGVG